MGYSRRSTFAIAAAVAAVAAIAAPAPVQAQKTLRAVMHSDLKILDPIWTTAYIVRNHGYMVYDTLFAQDEKGVRSIFATGLRVSASTSTLSVKGTSSAR